jgi:hypothetical protein
MVTLYAKWGAGPWSVVRLLVAVALLGWASSATAQTVTADAAASDLPAGYIVLPKIVVHTTGSPTSPVLAGGVATDTLIQLTNINQTTPIFVHCFYVDANSHCGGQMGGAICTSNADCPLGLTCVQLWNPTNFTIGLTPGQPIGFTAAGGLKPVPCDQLSEHGCLSQSSGFIPPVREDPFIGELKCVEVDVDDNPLPENDIKAEATVITTVVPPLPPGGTGTTTAASYNGIGFQADETFIRPLGADSSDPLCLGSTVPPGSLPGAVCRQRYAPCPGVLILNHFFDGATTELGGVVDTELTLAPCSEDLRTDNTTFQVTAQMLIYNEFEQRFSSGTKINCYRATRLSDIDTALGPGGDSFSIFSVGVQGTEVGQTRIRGVQGAANGLGYGLLGVACENYHATSTSGPVLSRTSFNLHEDGFRQENDAVFVVP